MSENLSQNNFYEFGEWEKALKYYYTILSSDSKNVKYWYRCGRCYLNLGNLPMAKKILTAIENNFGKDCHWENLNQYIEKYESESNSKIEKNIDPVLLSNISELARKEQIEMLRERLEQQNFEEEENLRRENMQYSKLLSAKAQREHEEEEKNFQKKMELEKESNFRKFLMFESSAKYEHSVISEKETEHKKLLAKEVSNLIKNNVEHDTEITENVAAENFHFSFGYDEDSLIE